MKTHAILPLLLASGVGTAATLHVQPRNPSAGQWPTIAAALTQAETGDTILIADGTYREAIDLRTLRATTHSAAIVIAAAPGARPVIKGSDLVTGWQRLAGDGTVYVKREWTENSQQVFVDGKALKQIAGTIFNGFPVDAAHAFAKLHESQGGIWPGRVGSGRQDMVAESFYYDAAAASLYIKTAANVLGGARVEVSVRPYVVIGGDFAGVELRGLTFEHASTTSISQSGAISLQADRVVLRDVVVRNVDGACVDITGDDARIENSSFNFCGIVGMKVRGRNARLTGNETSFNNTRGFNKWWEAGGAKFVGGGGLRDSEITAHRAYGNNGDGLWFDWNNDNNRIHGNAVAFNSGTGIHYEASTRAHIQGNWVVGNAQRGVYLPNASQSLVEHNLIAGNGMEGVAAVDERQAIDKGPPEFVPHGNRVTGNVIAFSGKAAVVLPARVQGSVSNDNVFASADSPMFSLDWVPLFKDLASWRENSQQDTRSSWRQMEMPAGMMQAITERRALSPATLAPWQQFLNTLASEPAARTTANQVRLAVERTAIASSKPIPSAPRLEKTQ